MAYPQKSTVQSIEDKDSGSDSKPSKPSPQGPPKAIPRPKSAADSSIYSSVGKSAMQEGQSGLGAEGSSPQLMATQGLTMVQRGLSLLNLAFPQNPGLVAVTADLMGRLQMILPQLAGSPSDSNGMGLLPAAMGMNPAAPSPGPAPMMGSVPTPMGAPGMPPTQ